MIRGFYTPSEKELFFNKMIIKSRDNDVSFDMVDNMWYMNNFHMDVFHIFCYHTFHLPVFDSYVNLYITTDYITSKSCVTNRQNLQWDINKQNQFRNSEIRTWLQKWPHEYSVWDRK